MKKEIIIFICENRKVATEIVDKYLDNGRITYVNILKADRRKEVVRLLGTLEQ